LITIKVNNQAPSQEMVTPIESILRGK